MTRQHLLLHVLALMLCACLPMTPIMSAGMETLSPQYIANLNGEDSSADLPIRSPQSERWDLLQIKAPEAWRLVSGGQENVVVAVLDTGIDVEHRAFKNKVIQKTSFASTTGIDTQRGHGTAIAGIIAGAADDSGALGVAYNCSLMDVQIAENNGSTDALKVANGIIWAADHGAKIINISIVIRQPYTPLEDAVNYAWEKGCLIVAAAGNDGSCDPVYPAAYPHVISVAASDKTDSLAGWSNWGEWVSVAAPGVDILSVLPGDKYGWKSGSSFSTGLVSGEAALLYPRTTDIDHDGRVNDEVRNIILNNCDIIGEAGKTCKRIDIYDSARAVGILTEASVKDSN